MAHPRGASRHPLKGALPAARQSRIGGSHWMNGDAVRAFSARECCE